MEQRNQLISALDAEAPSWGDCESTAGRFGQQWTEEAAGEMAAPLVIQNSQRAPAARAATESAYRSMAKPGACSRHHKENN
jgi:hypothetical protein